MLPFQLQQKILFYNSTDIAVIIKKLIKSNKTNLSFVDWYFESIQHDTYSHDEKYLESAFCAICVFNACETCEEECCICNLYFE